MDITDTFRPEEIKSDFFDFVASDAIGIGIGDRHGVGMGGGVGVGVMGNDSMDQPLQGFDQFWGTDKDINKLDSTIFDDLNRCWNQQSGGGDIGSQVGNTDGQVKLVMIDE